MMGIRHTRTLLTATLLLFLHAASGRCAPVGNIGDPALWNDRLFKAPGSRTLFISAEYDSQDNSLDDQQRRVRWDDPRSSTEEVRHYEQIRASESTFTCMGTRIGAVLTDAWTLYALTGVCDTELTFIHTDTTVNFGFETSSDFESDSDLYYGIGTTVLLHKGTFRGTVPLTLGMDITYRRFDFEDDSLSENGTFYSATLDEIQLAIVLAADFGRVHPYAGARISSITGNEHYINKTIESYWYPQGYIDYEDDITWTKNVGFVVGASVQLPGAISLTVESRLGDEEALGVSATVAF
ncbi:hypothetical protein [Desulfoluna spongiiphila]|uniref:hypothetical protein n=1 Tax=Desulfoluna spongiiphila TaxID=419481 RepID=UPI001253B987|nr:hypothetical protein [Desulfoluna spongiiphila]VVS91735.1 hypothetical protein DBB_13030 [Desulfoluna spongiiphila]